MWTGGDVSARYERSRIAAQQKVDQDDARQTPITNSSPSLSETQSPSPYTSSSPSLPIPPIPIPGKATLQANSSRQQVLETPPQDGGGAEVLADEAREEREAQNAVKSSIGKSRARAVSSGDSLKGLKERVKGQGQGQGGQVHARVRGMLGVDGGR